MRIDKYLVENKYFSSREKAVYYIKNNKIKFNGKVINKPSFDIKSEGEIEILNDEINYVSRGGKKLEHAIKCFNLDFKDKIILDIGSSTGGFTDCSLKNGAKLVCAIDVGTNQMDYNLSIDKRVVLKENFNLKNLQKDTFEYQFDYVVTDVSFISLKHVFLVLEKISSENMQFIALIKPQFETENEYLNDNGVIKDKFVHINVIKKIIDYGLSYGFYLKNLTFSPIKGKKEGNIEFLAHFSRIIYKGEINVDEIVNAAHQYFF